MKNPTTEDDNWVISEEYGGILKLHEASLQLTRKSK